MRVLFLGHIIGKPGLLAAKTLLSTLQKEENIDFTIAGASYVTHSFGLGKGHAMYLRRLGIQVLTGHDPLFTRQDLVADLGTLPFVLRPANFPAKTTPGRGHAYYKMPDSPTPCITVLCLQGQTFAGRAIPNNPFNYTVDLIDRLKQTTPRLVVCFHASTTAEKQGLAAHLAGRVSAVIGYGARALTSDAKIVSNTACLCDCGYVGELYSAGGLDSACEIERLMTQRSIRSQEATPQNLCLDATMVDIDDQGQATGITSKRLFITYCESEDTQNE